MVYVRHRVYVDVLGSDLWVAEDADAELYFPVRPTCAALDLDSRTALATIKADSRLVPGLRLIELPSPPRGDHELQCLRSDEYTWWLALLDPRRFKPERRVVLEERQRVLMRLAKEIMLHRGDLHRLPMHRSTAPQAVGATSGQISGNAPCPYCQRLVHMTLDGTGWHLHAGVEAGE